ncbi:MAG: hypothetical protein QXM76_01495 [Zestosphaera sp.]
MIGKALVSGLSIALSVVLVLMIAVTPLGYGVGERVDEAGIVIPVNYTVYYECPGGQDPFAGSNGFLTNTGLARFALGSSGGHINFYSLSAGTILDKKYVIDGDTIVQMLYFYFTSTTTTAVTINSQISGSTTSALYIPSRTYEANRVYRYTLTFPKVTYTTNLGNVTLGLGWPRYNYLESSTTVKFYNSGTEVLINPSFSLQYTSPSTGSTTWTVNFIISFNDANDVGKTFNELSMSTSGSWTNYEHVRIVLNQPFTIQDVGDRIVLAITFQLVPLS